MEMQEFEDSRRREVAEQKSTKEIKDLWRWMTLVKTNHFLPKSFPEFKHSSALHIQLPFVDG